MHPNPRLPGLHPKNELYVELYRQCCRDQREGMGGVLIGTLTAADAMAVIDLYADELPCAIGRKEALAMVRLIDREATRVRGEREDRQRDLDRLKAENAARSKRGR